MADAEGAPLANIMRPLKRIKAGEIADTLEAIDRH
jgi:hypothetical protein